MQQGIDGVMVVVSKGGGKYKAGRRRIDSSADDTPRPPLYKYFCFEPVHYHTFPSQTYLHDRQHPLAHSSGGSLSTLISTRKLPGASKRLPLLPFNS